MLTEMQTKFVREYVKRLIEPGLRPNVTEAAMAAGCSATNASAQGSKWLELPKVQLAIQEKTAQLAAVAELDAAWVLSQWKQIAEADVNELMQLRLKCCHYCWGHGHQYQWTEGAFTRAVTQAIERRLPPPDGMGGFGYDMNMKPNPDCPECGGLGEEFIHFSDTRNLSGSARRLYAGAKQTKEGLQILMRDQDGALNNIAKYLQLLVERREISGPNGTPIPIAANVTAKDFTDEQLAAIIAQQSLPDAATPE